MEKLYEELIIIIIQLAFVGQSHVLLTSYHNQIAGFIRTIKFRTGRCVGSSVKS